MNSRQLKAGAIAIPAVAAAAMYASSWSSHSMRESARRQTGRQTGRTPDAGAERPEATGIDALAEDRAV